MATAVIHCTASRAPATVCWVVPVSRVGRCGSEAAAAVKGQQHQPPPLPQQQDGEEARVEALVLEQQLEAQLRDVADVVCASQLDGCFSSMLQAAAAMGRYKLFGALLTRSLGSSSAPADNAQRLDIQGGLAAAVLTIVEKGHAQCLRLLLESYPSTSSASVAELLDARDGKGRTACITAARQGHTDCMQLLLEHSPHSQVADVDTDGVNALMGAAHEGHTACVQLLLRHSPHTQVAAVDRQDMSALMRAAQEGHTASVQLLLHHIPDTQVLAADRHGQTALMLAAYKGATACVQLLLRHSPDIQVAAASVRGSNALICAAHKGATACVQLLLHHRPDIQLAAHEVDGAAAFSRAADQAHADCLQLLLAHGPSKLQLGKALRLVCRRMADLARERASSADSQRRLAFQKCAELLLAHRAVLPANATDDEKEVLPSIVADLAARALVPDMANEAVVGLALAASRR